MTAGAWAQGGRNRVNKSADVGRPSRFGLGRILPPPGRRVGGGHGGRTVRPVGSRRVGRFGASAGPPGSAPRPVLWATVAVGPTFHVAPGAASTLMLDRPRQGHLEGLGMPRQRAAEGLLVPFGPYRVPEIACTAILSGALGRAGAQIAQIGRERAATGQGRALEG